MQASLGENELVFYVIREEQMKILFFNIKKLVPTDIKPQNRLINRNPTKYTKISPCNYWIYIQYNKNVNLCKLRLHAVTLTWIKKSMLQIKTKAGKNVSRKFQNM